LGDASRWRTRGGGIALFHWLTQEVSNNPVTYVIIFGAAATDVLLPLVPSETIVIAAAVIAAQGELLIVGVVAAATLGAMLGDNIAYLLGWRVGEPVAERLFRGEKAQRRLDWAEAAIRKRGMALIAIGRFIPGGRTASTFAAGTLGMPYRRFLLADSCAALIWATYVSLLGYVGGASFEDNVWLPLLIAFGLAMLVAGGVEAWRRIEARRGKDVFGDELDPAAEQPDSAA
jgi:membrane-associated protein